MFEKKEMFFAGRNIHMSRRPLATRLVLGLCLMALLVPGAVHATDPIDLDPDPDLTSPLMTIVVDRFESVDLGSLPPGHYLIIVRSEDGSQQTYELWL